MLFGVNITVTACKLSTNALIVTAPGMILFLSFVFAFVSLCFLLLLSACAFVCKPPGTWRSACLSITHTHQHKYKNPGLLLPCHRIVLQTSVVTTLCHSVFHLSIIFLTYLTAQHPSPATCLSLAPSNSQLKLFCNKLKPNPST